MKDRKKIFNALLLILGERAATRRELLDQVVAQLSGEATSEPTAVGPKTNLRAGVGEVINEMESGGIISLYEGKYSLTSSKPVILRAEKCEKAILELLRNGGMSKQRIRASLVKRFGTDKTITTRDDQILFSYIGQILKKLTDRGVLQIRDSTYSISPEKAARIDDIGEVLALKGDFLARVHSRGGEFFEHYFMSLLSKFLEKHGKTVVECYATGGSADGGVDGIATTVDALGFRETIMVQVKNRLEITNETTVRGFWGAVCAQAGTRGIFATSSDFHPGAKKFLDGIDNCVGVNGDTLFKMACECRYGIKMHGGKLVLDTKII